MSSATWPVESAVIGAPTEAMNSTLAASISGMIASASSSKRWRSRGAEGEAGGGSIDSGA